MIKNWRLTTDVTVMIKAGGDKNKEVYLAPPEKKYETSVSKLIDSYYNPVTIENKSISLKIESNSDTGGFNLYMFSPNLPGGSEKDIRYQIMNFDTSSIWGIIEQCNIVDGKPDGEFYAVFSDNLINKVSFVSKSMKDFNKCNEEMRRRINCEYFKKTKKIVFGHRYDSIKETRYYLCEVNSRKQNDTHSEFLANGFAASNKLYLYVNNLKETDTSIAQVLSSRCFGFGDYDIKVAYDSPSFMDSGSVLTDDFSGNIKDYWEVMFDNAVKECKKVDAWGYTIYKDIRKILEIFAYQNDADMTYKIDKNLYDSLVEILSTTLNHNLLVYWKLYNADASLMVNDKNSFDTNINALIKLFYKNLVDPNLYKALYYDELFKEMNIQLESIARNVLVSWDESNITSSFENFLKYRFFYTNKQFLSKKTIMDFISNQVSEKTASGDDDEGDKKNLLDVSALFGKSELTDSIIDLYDYSNSNFGLGVTDYEIVNFGTKSKPRYAVYSRITLEDLIKYKKGTENMSETLKNEITRNKFNSIVVIVDKSEKIK